MKKFIMSLILLLAVGSTVFAQDGKVSALKAFEQKVVNASDDYVEAKASIANIFTEGKEVVHLAYADLSEMRGELHSPPSPSLAKEPANSAKIVKESSGVIEKGKNAVETVYTDGTDAVSTVYNDGKGVISTAYEDIKASVQHMTPVVGDAVESLAKGLKVGAEELFKILVLQQVVYSVVYTIVLIMMVLLLMAFIKEKKKYLVYLKEYTNNKDISQNKSSVAMQHWIFMLIYISGVVITGAIFISNIIPFVMGYVNPEYGAVMEILEYAQKFIKQ